MKIWNPWNGACLKTIAVHSAPILSLLQLDDSRVLTMDEERLHQVCSNVYLWKVKENDLEYRKEGRFDQYKKMVFLSAKFFGLIRSSDIAICLIDYFDIT